MAEAILVGGVYRFFDFQRRGWSRGTGWRVASALPSRWFPWDSCRIFPGV